MRYKLYTSIAKFFCRRADKLAWKGYSYDCR